MIDLRRSRFCDLLPPNLRTPHTLALSAAFDRQMRDLVDTIPMVYMLALVERMAEPLCDQVALGYNIAEYRLDLPLAANVTASVKSGMTLTPEDMEHHNRDPEAHKPTHPLATIRHGRGRYPLCELTCTEHAAGVTPAGTGPAGGTAPRSIPFQVEYPSRNEIRLLVTDDLAGEIFIRQLDADRYALLYPEGAESLMLIVQ